MKTNRMALTACMALVFANGAHGQFVTGHVFVAAFAGEECDPSQGFDVIVEIDPTTGATSPKTSVRRLACAHGAGRRLTARTVPPVVGDGCMALGCSFVMLSSRACWGPTRTGTSIPRHHEANSTP